MKICIPIRADYQNEVEKKLRQVAQKADLAEIWLDQINDLDLEALLKNKPLPVVCVWKRALEGGRFRGSHAALSECLLRAVNLRADYIDIPMQMPEILSKKVVQEAQKKPCKIIVSYHDFKKTPDYPKLLQLAESLQERGADIIKIACYANSLEDTVNVLALAKHLEQEKRRHILIAMGPKGVLSRVLTPTLGGEMMFATLGKKGQTAPGQLSVKQLRHAWSLIKTK